MAAFHMTDVGLSVWDPQEAFSTCPTSVLHTNSVTRLPCRRALSYFFASITSRLGYPWFEVLWWHSVTLRCCLFLAFFCFTSENPDVNTLQRGTIYFNMFREMILKEHMIVFALTCFLSPLCRNTLYVHIFQITSCLIMGSWVYFWFCHRKLLLLT